MAEVPSGDNGNDRGRVAERLDPIVPGERARTTIARAVEARRQADASLALVVNAVASALDVPEGWQYREGAFHPPVPRRELPVVDFDDLAREAVRRAVGEGESSD